MPHPYGLRGAVSKFWAAPRERFYRSCIIRLSFGLVLLFSLWGHHLSFGRTKVHVRFATHVFRVCLFHLERRSCSEFRKQTQNTLTFLAGLLDAHYCRAPFCFWSATAPTHSQDVVRVLPSALAAVVRRKQCLATDTARAGRACYHG